MSESVTTQAPSTPAPAEQPKAVTPTKDVIAPKEAGKEEPSKLESDPKSQEAFSKRFSALNRERKEIDQAKAQFLKEKAAVEAEKAELAKWKQERESYKKPSNPLEALKAAGYSYEDAAQFILNDEKPTPDMQIKGVAEKIAELEAKLQEKERIALEQEEKLLKIRQQEDNQVAINAIKDHLSKKPENDIIIALGLESDIFQKITEHYNKTGEVLQIDDVASEALQKIEEHFSNVSKTNYFKSKFSQPAQIKEPPKTLSSSLHSQTTPPEKKHYKTDEERVKNALAMLAK